MKVFVYFIDHKIFLFIFTFRKSKMMKMVIV